MTPAEYRIRYLSGLTLATPTSTATDDACLQALLPGPQRLFGPDLPGEPLLLARRQALLGVLRGALPDQADGMDLPGLTAWLQDAGQARARLRELEVHLGHVQRHEQELDQERLRLQGDIAHLQGDIGHLERACAQLREGAEQDRWRISELEAIRNSTSYRLGRTLLAPLAPLRRLVRRWGRRH